VRANARHDLQLMRAEEHHLAVCGEFLDEGAVTSDEATGSPGKRSSMGISMVSGRNLASGFKTATPRVRRSRPQLNLRRLIHRFGCKKRFGCKEFEIATAPKFQTANPVEFRSGCENSGPSLLAQQTSAGIKPAEPSYDALAAHAQVCASLASQIRMKVAKPALNRLASGRPRTDDGLGSRDQWGAIRHHC